MSNSENRRLKTTNPRRLLAAVFIAIFCVFQGSLVIARGSFAAPVGPADPAFVSTETREGRLAVFDDVWSTINERYYDTKFHGLDWGVQKENYRGLAAEAGSSRELYVVLRRMIAGLDDSHTRVYPPEEK